MRETVFHIAPPFCYDAIIFNFSKNKNGQCNHSCVNTDNRTTFDGQIYRTNHFNMTIELFIGQVYNKNKEVN